MPARKLPNPRIALGDWVRITHTSGLGLQGRVIGLREGFGPEGENIFRVRMPRGRRAAYIEVREDQLRKTPKPEKPKPAPPQPAE